MRCALPAFDGPRFKDSVISFVPERLVRYPGSLCSLAGDGGATDMGGTRRSLGEVMVVVKRKASAPVRSEIFRRDVSLEIG
jgi:hypothetical protein